MFERQSLGLSDTLGNLSSLRGPSNRRRDESREGKSGSGPSRLHGLSNLPSSPPPKPERSLGGSATLTRIVLPEKLEPLRARASFRPSKSSNSTYPKPLGLSSLSLIILTDFGLFVAKKSSNSDSTKSNARFPMKAVYGGAVGSGRSSRGGPETRSGRDDRKSSRRPCLSPGRP